MLYFVLERIGPSVIMTCLAQVIYHRDLAFTYITSRRDSSNLELLRLSFSLEKRPRGRRVSASLPLYWSIRRQKYSVFGIFAESSGPPVWTGQSCGTWR